MDPIFYIYGHTTADTKELFYVGKGKGGRSDVVLHRNPIWTRIAQKHGVIRTIYYSNLTEAHAFELERAMIAKYHPRANISLGGDGPCGVVPTTITRNRMSEAAKRRWSDPEVIRQKSELTKRTWTPEHKERMRKIHKARLLDPEARRIHNEYLSRPNVRLQRSETMKRTLAKKDKAIFSGALKRAWITRRTNKKIKLFSK